MLVERKPMPQTTPCPLEWASLRTIHTFHDAVFSVDEEGVRFLIVTKEAQWFVSHGGENPRSVPLRSSVCISPFVAIWNGFERPYAFVRGAMSLDGRHAMVSALSIARGDAEGGGGWAIEVFDAETGDLVGSAKHQAHYEPTVAADMRCMRFPGVLMALLEDTVVMFDQSQPDRFHVQTASDFAIPVTSHLFANGARVATRLEPMVDRTKARAVQSDGRTIVYSVVEAPSSKSLSTLRLLEHHRTVDVLSNDVRCALSPDGLHILTLSTCGPMQMAADVHHYRWPSIRAACMAMTAAISGKCAPGREDTAANLPTPVAAQILGFLLDPRDTQSRRGADRSGDEDTENMFTDI